MEPQYMNENRYSYLVGFWKPLTNVDYEMESPETECERAVQTLFMEGQRHLHQEEYALALRAFLELRLLILFATNPQMPVDPNQIPQVVFPMDVSLVDTLAAKAAEMLQKTPVPMYKFPSSLMSQQSILPGPVVEKLKPALENGLQISSYHNEVSKRLEAAFAAIAEDDFILAQRHYLIALQKVPETDPVLRASLLHDTAILAEKANDRNQAQELARQSVQVFETTRLPEAQVQALDTQVGILRRAGQENLADEQAQKALEIRKTNNINPVVRGRLDALSTETLVRPIRRVTPRSTGSRLVEPVVPDTTRAAPLIIGLQATPESTVDAPTLMAMKYVQPNAVVKTLNVQGTETTATLNLDANAVANVKAFLQTVSDTK